MASSGDPAENAAQLRVDCIESSILPSTELPGNRYLCREPVTQSGDEAFVECDGREIGAPLQLQALETSKNGTTPQDGITTCLESWTDYVKGLSKWYSERNASPLAVPECCPTVQQNLIERVQEWLQRPARQQVKEDDALQYSHTEGQQEYNIWYGKYLTDRYNKSSYLDRESAHYKCDPSRDAGYTKASSSSGSAAQFFCVFFAKGCCHRGKDCHFKHHIPTSVDEGTLDWSCDVFGRTRFKNHREDMTGVGSIDHECKTLFVGGLQVDASKEDGLRDLEDFLWREFGVWGNVISVRVIPKKHIAFVSYEYRVQAEFAKIAMADQHVGTYGAILNVKWAHHDGQTKRKLDLPSDSRKKPHSSQAETAVVDCWKAVDDSSAPVDAPSVHRTLSSYYAAWQVYWERMQQLTSAHTQSVPLFCKNDSVGGSAAQEHDEVYVGPVQSDPADDGSARLESIMARIEQYHDTSL